MILLVVVSVVRVVGVVDGVIVVLVERLYWLLCYHHQHDQEQCHLLAIDVEKDASSELHRESTVHGEFDRIAPTIGSNAACYSCCWVTTGSWSSAKECGAAGGVPQCPVTQIYLMAD